MSVQFNIAQSGFSIRPAGAADAKALRMLLPELPDAAVNLVAVDGEHQLVIGAAAATRSSRPQPLAGPGIAVRVIEPCRRHGVGASLLAHLERAAPLGHAKAFYGAKRVDHGSSEMRGWEWLGFKACETVEEHALPLEQIESSLGPLMERMRARGRIPISARIIPLYQASLADVLQLHLDCLGGDRADLSRKLRGEGPAAYLPRHSRVLMVDDRLKGCLLAHRTGKDAVTIDANIVEPALRGGWANAWLKLEACRGAPAGVKEVRFTTFDHYTDTRSFTKKLRGMTMRRTMLMFRPIA